MKRFLGPLLIIGALITSGCESAIIPMGDSDDVPVDHRLVGQWVSEMEDEDRVFLDVWAFNETEYYVEWTEEEEDSETARLRAFATDVKDMMFLNVTCVACDDDEQGDWYFVEYDVDQDEVLRLNLIEDNHYRDAMGDMTRARDIRNYIKKHMNEADFFDDEPAHFVRMEEE